MPYRLFATWMICWGCLVGTGVPECAGQTPLPPGQGAGPWQNDLLLRVLRDNKPIGRESVFVAGGGVPSLTRATDGRLIAAFQWFPLDGGDHFDRVAVKISRDDGMTWTDPQPITIEEFPAEYQRPFDPTIVALDDGRLRLYFTSSPTGRPDLNASTAIYSAISTDGVNYRFEPGRRFGVEGHRVIDCAVGRLGDTWHMLAPVGRPEEGAFHAISTDGLKFLLVRDIPSGRDQNWTGNLISRPNRLEFYGSSRQGLWTASSTNGSTWSAPRVLNLTGGDPGVTLLPNGDLLLLCVSPPHFDRATPRR